MMKPDGDLADRFEHRPERSRSTLGTGYAMSLVDAEIDLGDAGVVRRQFLTHLGAVAILPMRGDDGAEEVLLIQQYRHPVGAFDWEIPAGLLDAEAETPLEAAARELAEEADLKAETWHTLVDFWTSPGSSEEAIRVYLARDLSDLPAFEREGEEAGMPLRWVSLDSCVAAVVAGKVHNPSLVNGVLAAHVIRAGGWAGLRPADAPFDIHQRWRP